MSRVAGATVDLSSARRWLGVPWQDWTVALALVAAAGAPSFLEATADIWRVAAGDEIAARLVEVGHSSDQWVAVETIALFTASGSADADSAVRDTMSAIDSIEEPVQNCPRHVAWPRLAARAPLSTLLCD